MINRINVVAVISTVILLGISNSSWSAGSCGIGKLLEIKEGGWNSDDLVVRIDFSVEGVAINHVDKMYKTQYIRFKENTIGLERLRSIRALAYVAMAGDRYVRVWSHTGGCANSTELNMLADSAVVSPN